MRKRAHFGTDLPDSFIQEIWKLIDSSVINSEEYLVFEIKIHDEIYKIDIGMSKQETEKTCNKCGRTLPIGNFYLGTTRRSGDGRESICKECRIDSCKTYQKKQAMMYKYKNKIRKPKAEYTIDEESTK